MLSFKMRNGKLGSYQPSPDDYLWLLRAVAAEGPVQAQVAQTLVNLFCLLRSKGYKGTLTDLVRAYAQPVNPRWYINGDLFIKANTDGVPADAAAARRRERVHSKLRKFSDETFRAVETALETGLTDVPAHATDYAAWGVDASKKGYVLLSTDRPRGRNQLWARDPKWTGYTVVPPTSCTVRR